MAESPDNSVSPIGSPSSIASTPPTTSCIDDACEVEVEVEIETIASPPEIEQIAASPASPVGYGAGSIQTKLRYGVADVQGKRSTMEDAYQVNLTLTTEGAPLACAFFGVYDGHGGRRASEFCGDVLHKHFVAVPDWHTNPLDALRSATLKTEEEFLAVATSEQLQDGSTTVTAVIIGNSLYVANAGDSELILCRGGEARVLTEVHNPCKNPDEIDRIKRAGGRLHNNRVGHPYLNAQFFSLGVSKAIGDMMYKHPEYTDNRVSGVTADPHLSHVVLNDNDDFIIMACDGLWDVFKYEEAAEFVLERLKLTNDPQAVCDELVKEAEYVRESQDNITAIIITWKHFSS